MKRIKVVGLSAILGLMVGAVLAAAAFASGPELEGSGLILNEPFGDSAATAQDGPVSPLLAKEIAVLTGQGISPARAMQAIAVQGKVADADLGRRLQAAMGGAYAGVWFEPAAAEVHVGVVSSASRETAEAVVAGTGLTTDVVFTPVRSTVAQLLATQHRWNSKLAGLLASGDVATGLQPQRNAVTVQLSESVAPRVRAALRREAAAADANVVVSVAASAHLRPIQDAKECNNFPKEAPNCEIPITSGVKIERSNAETGKGNGETNKTSTIKNFEAATLAGVLVGDEIDGPGVPEETIVISKTATSVTLDEVVNTAEVAAFTFLTGAVCSAGPAAIPEANKKLRVLLTAGHCIQSGHGTGAEWKAFNRKAVGGLIGKAGSFQNGGAAGGKFGDFGEIAIEAGGAWQSGNPRIPVLAVTAEWNKNEETRYAVKNEKEPKANEVTCHEGQTSGESCGLIVGFNKEIKDALGTAEGLVEVNEPKGAKERLISRGGDSGGPFLFIEANNEARMEGTLVGRLTPECPKVAKQKGPQFFATKAECEKGKEEAANEGEFERRLVVLFNPLKKVMSEVHGSLEVLKLELLTTANENRTKELEQEEKEEKETKEKEEKEHKEKEEKEKEKEGKGLPEFKVETKSAGTSGKNELAAEGSSIKCESATDEFVPTSKKEGTFTIHFKECKGPLTVGKCWSLGDAKGEILVGGEWHLVRSTKGESEPLVWLLFATTDGTKAVHLECEKVLGLVLLWGNLLLTISPFGKEAKEFSLVVEREGEKQRIRKYENNEGKEVEAEGLKASIDGGSARSAGEESKENRLTTEKETEIVG
jgi:hypothetical protein